ncbi:MAG TPA: tetratricopeptide repeat protein [Bryobacteraceae bacterium]|nr:tetratricopeptide repeat protein [Bryobacteraceae bacterium]
MLRVAALACLGACWVWAQDAQAILSALRANHPAEALQLAQQALQKTPRNAQLITLEGLAFKGLGQPEKALSAFRQALRIDPNYLAALEGAAQIEYAAAAKEAIPDLDHLLELRPGEPTANAMRAVMAWRAGDCSTAVKHFEQSGSAIESQPDALRGYAVCLVRLRRFDDAGPIANRLGDPRFVAAVELSAERSKPALEALRPLIDGANPDAEALAMASVAYEAMGDTPNAVAALRRAIVLSPRTIRYYIDFANLSFAHKSYEAGIQVLNAGIALTPGASQLRLARGILYVQTGQDEQAEADFAAAERLDPKQPGTVDAEVLARLQKNDLDGAARLVREKIRARPKNAFLHYLLAEVLDWQGPPAGSPLFNQALTAAKEAVRFEPGLLLARNLLSRLYLDAGQVKPAIEQCRLVLKDDPHDPIALYRLMRALRMSDDPADAREIPEVVRRFNEARELANQKEAQENRYRLVDVTPRQ